MKFIARFVVVACFLGIGGWTEPAEAFLRYNDGCASCHGHFADAPYDPLSGGPTWPDSLHVVHRGSAYMDSTCNLCHTNGDGKDPFIGSSQGTGNTTGYGCTGCHGQSDSGTVSGVGLRLAHGNVGVSSCAGCHSSDPPAQPESTPPPYYGLPDTLVDVPCNDDAGTSEDWSGDGQGLDNDGDGDYDGGDSDCLVSGCGNGSLDPGETCDPPSSCPTDCNDANACTDDSMAGSPATCDVVCTNTTITSCVDADGCCPAACDATNDDDCSAFCGNSVVEPGETCDPPGSCPSSCDDGDTCTSDSMAGSPSTCDVVCSNPAISSCSNGDGCCPGACDATNDSDCTASCGNGVVEPGETCDPTSSCPTSCDDSDACTADVMSGAVATCDVACSNTPVTACANGDGCCPGGCDATSDDDCGASCGNGVIEAGETCDPPGSCPTTCDDGDVCTADTLSGSAATCDVTCANPAITSCANGDGCCPAACDQSNDGDCSAVCDNGVIESGETCDPVSSCPTVCDDGDACTTDVLSGDASTCDASCGATSVTVCSNGDGCCPSGCDGLNDDDCTATCGNGVVETGETCDPPGTCPTACDDGDVCTADALQGSAGTCDASCVAAPITVCSNGDGCCPAGCDANSDGDCSPVCGNDVIEAGETCDPVASCPTSCDDGSPCTTDALSGDPAACTSSCGSSPILTCGPAEGCCPPGCTVSNDGDCGGAAVCGNGIIELGETCDPPGSCPTSCDDGNACTVDSLTGAAGNCDVVCASVPLTACTKNDGCCPAGCSRPGDNDCSNQCGDGDVDNDETCDLPATCPADCDDSDACTEDILTGSAVNCNVDCSHIAVVVCVDADGCCPAGCDQASDDDCGGGCGDGTIDAGETCDPPGTCPTACDDGDSCTQDVLTGSALSCDAACTFPAVVVCANGDSCCAPGCDANNDGDCGPVCDNGVVESGETCDPQASCPTACDDGNSCTVDSLSGAAATCDAQCDATPVTACSDGDGCCPGGCDATIDDDCSPVCGNAVVESGETCDPPGSCPATCDDGDACTADVLSGAAAACTAQCTSTAISACANGDGCCPSGCNANNDSDCSPSCGNDVVESGETCDPPGSCPTACDDADPCTTDALVGDPGACTASCTTALVTACAADGCCPSGCDANSDSDCSASCGNGVVEAGETCDPPGTCPLTCDDGNNCTADTLMGSASTCDATCDQVVVTACGPAEGCCPTGCDAVGDVDCSPSCGNDVVEAPETCDPPSSCPTACDDGNVCTTDVLTGAVANCSAACSSSAIVGCADGDGCCPAGCDSTSDNDCSSTCGNGVVETGETCDPPSSCPMSCDDGNGCTVDSLTGAAASCNSACAHQAIVACGDGDACCPAGCDATLDDGCSPSCGNDVLEPTETCDPPSSCPTACDDGNSCTVDTMTGASATCSSACSYQPIVSCGDGDGCCPAGCDANDDDDCSATCGNGTVEPGETCDPPGSCPAGCDDGNACTVDSATGSASSCSAACSNQVIVSCVDGDGCCPASCNANVDDDCSASCDNGIIEAGETCDPPESCPECDDGVGCTTDVQTGSAAGCNVACSYQPIVSCAHGDGCCPAGCDASIDDDCSASCGNNIVEPGETCDPPLSCMGSCDDDNACTIDTQTGAAVTCNVACTHQPIVSCVMGAPDGCCPAGCDSDVDADCSATCGNGTVEAGETCDPPSSCETTCDDGDACTLDVATGAAETCNSDCSHSSVSLCGNGDGCCPAGCDAAADDDCAETTCGDGVVGPGETCDPPGSCPVCDSADACVQATGSGSAETCDLVCGTAPVAACAHGDGCCVEGCSAEQDDDCVPTMPPTPSDPGGCDCQTGDARPDGGLVLLLGLFGLWVVRRRRVAVATGQRRN